MTGNARALGTSTVLRAGALGDAGRIAGLQLASWRLTYANELSPAFRNSQDVLEWTADWRSEIANGVNVILAENRETLLGFVACGAPRRGSAGIVGWEIYNLHTHPDRHGEGIGSRLFHAAVELGRQRGAHQLVLWVVETNTPARGFYERKGMQLDGGAQAHHVGGEVLCEVRYRMPI